VMLPVKIRFQKVSFGWLKWCKQLSVPAPTSLPEPPHIRLRMASVHLLRTTLANKNDVDLATLLHASNAPHLYMRAPQLCCKSDVEENNQKTNGEGAAGLLSRWPRPRRWSVASLHGTLPFPWS